MATDVATVSLDRVTWQSVTWSYLVAAQRLPLLAGYGALVDLQPGDLLVVRLWKWDAERLRMDADIERRRREVEGEEVLYAISTFGMVVPPGVDQETVVGDLLAHVAGWRRAKWASLTTGRRLEETGFKVLLSEPPPQHYDVVLGDTLTTANVEALETIFNEYERRRMPACTT